MATKSTKSTAKAAAPALVSAPIGAIASTSKGTGTANTGNNYTNTGASLSQKAAAGLAAALAPFGGPQYGMASGAFNGTGNATNGNAANASLGAMLSLSDQLQALYNSVPALKNDYVRPAYMDVIDPRLRTAMELADQFGINYDKNAIMSAYQNAVNKEYAVRYGQQANTEANYYDNIAALQNTTLDSLRQQQSQAIQAGTNRGMAAANQLSAVLGVSQAAMQSANEIAQSRSLLAKEQGAAEAQAAVDGMKYYDTLGTQLGDVAKQIYSYDVQQQAAQLAYNQGINTDYAGVMAQNQAAQAAIAQALAQGAAGITSNYTSTLGALEQARIAAAAQQAVAQANAAASKYAADTAAASSKYAADKNATAYANYSSGYTPYSATAYTPTGATGAANGASDAYLKQVLNMGANGAPSAVVQEAINTGLSSGVITNADLNKPWYINEVEGQVSNLRNTIPMPSSVTNSLTAPSLANAIAGVVPKPKTTTTTPKATTVPKASTAATGGAGGKTTAQKY